MTEMTAKNGRERITAAFQKAKQSQKAALMPYFTLGYPDMETSANVIEAIAPYADLMELGVPFSDPIADGPTIQESTQIALDNGTTVKKCLQTITSLRNKGVNTPVMMMGYYNPILAYGQEAFVRDAAAAGVDGFLVPDLPIEEADELDTLAEQHGLALIYFLAPTSNADRIARTAEKANGFIYLVSITGITGTKEAVVNDLESLIATIRQKTDVPVAVGFGINTPEKASNMGEIADGVIVGTALVKAVMNASEGKEAADAATFVQTLQAGLK